MKQFLITLSTLTTLTIATNSINSSISANTMLTNKSWSNDYQTSLFNNQYRYLSNDDWITNQSTIDNKYYSYDTSDANYLLSNGTSVRTLFIVDDKGNLTYKKEQ